MRSRPATSAAALTLAIEPGVLDEQSCWSAFESLAVQMSREVPLRASETTLAQLIDSVYGRRWAPMRGLVAPFACPRCGTKEDFARKSAL